MPILFPQVNTHIPSPKTDAAMASKNAMLKALLQGQALGIQGANQEGAMEAKGKADQEATEANLKRLFGALGSGDIPEGASVRMGNVAIGTDPTQRNAMQVTKGISGDYGNLNKDYSAIEKKYESVLGRLELGHTAMQRNDALGMKQAAVALAGSTEGPTQRILQSVINSFGGDPTILGNAELMSNFIDGLQRSKKSEAFKKSMGQALQDIHGQLGKNFEGDMQAFRQNAPVRAGMASSRDPNFSSQLGNYGSAMNKRFGALGESFKTPMQPPPGASADPQAQPGMMDKLKEFFGGPKAKPSTIIQNGISYTLDPKTGQYR